jgi:hypothetical protein
MLESQAYLHQSEIYAFTTLLQKERFKIRNADENIFFARHIPGRSHNRHMGI